jgi:hypothetical protein
MESTFASQMKLGFAADEPDASKVHCRINTFFWNYRQEGYGVESESPWLHTDQYSDGS